MALTPMFKKVGPMVASVFLALASPQSAASENLADALIGAYNTSGLLEQNRALLRAADEDVAIAVAALRPVLAWTVAMSRTLRESSVSGIVTDRAGTTASAGISFDLLLYDGGSRRLGVQRSKETVLATRQVLVSVEQSILLRAVRAYMTVVFQTENVSLRENNVRVLGEELRATQDRFEVGEVTRTDVALAESRLAAARSNLALARGQLVNAQAEYLRAVGSKPGALASKPQLPVRPVSLDAAQAVAVRNHPDILSVQRQVAAAELAILQAETNIGPSVGLGADIGLTETWDSTDYTEDASISLRLSQPIYQGGALAAQVRKAMASRDATRANLLNVQRDVLQNVSNALVRLEVSKASLIATDERIRAAQVAFDGIREEATLGARTTLDVLSAEQELLDARTAQISARAEEVIAAYEVIASQGLLTAERLGLAVQIYDPTIYYNLAKDAPATISRQSRDLDRVMQALGKK